ncbi:MAG: DUF5357 domain-containing protein [Calothrix sp. CSU_2_0]|nr:DUF5357 domain-containing protein [Calothrix sp. CSU_2_0]
MREIFQLVRNRIQPPDWASWQTLVALSAFSAIVAGMTSYPVQNIIAFFGWVFLILGVWWFTYEEGVKKKLTFNGLFVGPWIVGALISIWLFGSWQGSPTPASFISWPVISSIVWSIPRFVKTNPKTVTPNYTVPTPAGRQDIILLLLSNLILSCWFQFYFLLQDWLVDYPNLRADDFSRSAFVLQVQPQNRVDSRGVEVLNLAEQALKKRLEGRPWAEVERWLDDLDQEMPILADEVKKQLPQAIENRLWDLKGTIVSDRYTLQLQAIWQGPSARPTGYAVIKSCQITQTRKIGPPAQLDFKSSDSPAVSAPVSRSIGAVSCGEAALPNSDGG